MPPPKPSRPSNEKVVAKAAVVKVETAEDFAEVYNNERCCGGGGGGGCFTGDSLILMSDGSTKSVNKLKKGESIKTQNGNSSKIVCIIKFKTDTGYANLCDLNGLKITHHHPIMHNNTWVYPSTLVEPQKLECPAVYNLIVEDNHIAIINGTPVILLGHNYTEGILKHEYLGSSKVINDLKMISGWMDGQVEAKIVSKKNVKQMSIIQN